MAIQKTASGDLTTAIAKQIYQTAVMADNSKKDAQDVAAAYGVDPMLRRGEFFGHAAATKATSWLPRRFQHQMPSVTMGNPSYIARGQGIVDPLMGVPAHLRNLPEYQQFASPQERRAKPHIKVPQFERGNINDMFGLRSIGKKAVKVREEKLGKFLAAVILSLNKSLDSINKKMDDSESGVIVAKDGIAATHKKLEDNSDMLETKLDAIIDALRIQSDMKDQAQQDLKVAKKEAITEQEEDRSTTKEILMQDMDQAEIAEKNERDERSDDRGDETEQQLSIPQLAEGGIVSGPDSGYLAVLHGDEAVVPLDNNFTQGEPSAMGKRSIGSMPMLGGMGGFEMGSNPDTMKPSISSMTSISNNSSSSNVSGDTSLLAQAIELPAKAAGIVTMGIIGKVLSKGKVPGSAIPQIKSVVAPIASAFGVSDLVSQNISRDSAISGSEAGRRASGSNPDASGENKKKNFLQRMWGWVTGAGSSGGGTSIRNYRGGYSGGGGPIGNVGESAQGGGTISGISNSNYGGSNVGNLAFWGGSSPVDKMKFDPKQPDRPNPHPPGTLLYNIWQRRMQEYQMMKEAGMVSSSEFFTKVANATQNNEISPPGSVGAVYNLVNNESMEGEIRDLVTDVAHDPDVVLNNQSQGTTDNQVEYSPLAAKGSPFPVGFNISPYA